MKRALITLLLFCSLTFADVSVTTMPISYTGNGSTTAFAFGFSIEQTSDIIVILRVISTGIPSTLVETNDYVVSATNNDYSSGGTVTMVATYASTHTIWIYRDTDLDQDATLADSGVLRLASITNALDKLTRQVQELQEELDRCLKIPQTESLTVTAGSSVDRAGATLVWGAEGDLSSSAGVVPSAVSVTGYMETLLGLETASAARTHLEVTLVDDPEITSIAGLTSAANRLIHYTGSGAAELLDSTTFLRTTGVQTAAGNKTFSGVTSLGDTSTLATSAAPGADAQIANKKYVDDTVAGVGPAWTAFTPTVTQGVAVTSTKTYAKYVQIGKVCIVACNLTATSAGTGGQVIVVGNLPVAITGTFRALGAGEVTDTGTNSYIGTTMFLTSTSVSIVAHANGTAIGSSPSFALANNDFISFVITYETS